MGANYADVTGSCKPCSSNCTACFGGSSFECTACLATYTLLNGQCLASCPSGYTIASNTCIKCSSKCLTCASTNSCTTCLSGYWLSPQNTCLSDCAQLNSNTTFYYKNSNTSACSACSSAVAGCLACYFNTTSGVQCTKCLGSAVLYQGQCLASCPQGTYLLSGLCLPCTLSNCSSCTATACLSCTNSTILNNGICTTTCNLGSYLNLTSLSC